MGGMQMPSLVVLKKHEDDGQQIHLPIRIGPIEAAAITAGIEENKHKRPLTHDLLASVIGRAPRLTAVPLTPSP